jgi:hypothetical protein
MKLGIGLRPWISFPTHQQVARLCRQEIGASEGSLCQARTADFLFAFRFGKARVSKVNGAEQAMPDTYILFYFFLFY